jgi:predicted Zn-dependent peptidase
LLLAGALFAADVRLPQYTRQTLSNGIILDVVPQREVPLVSVQIIVRGGVESEPAELAGLASVTAEALRRGTAKRTAEQFSRELDALGATFDTGADMQSSNLTAEFLAKDLDAGLGLVIDALINPTFPEDEIKKLLAQRVDAAKAIKDNPQAAAGNYYRSFFYGPQHPYGRPADELSLARITRKDIVDYHKRMYVGRNTIVIIAGDVDPSRASAVAKTFSPFASGEAYAWKKAEPPVNAAHRVAIVNKPDATQTQFLIGRPGIDRTNPDRVTLWLVNTLFGGRFTSILNDELRVNTGLTYGAGSRFDQNHLRGRITMSTFTATENTGKAVDTAIALMTKLAEKGITAEQLASAKAYLKGTYPSEQLETSDQIAEIIGEIELFQLNRGEVDDLFSRIDAVTVEQANAAARKYYSAENLTFLFLGNAAKFADDLKKYDAKPVETTITKPGLRVQ